MRRLVECEECRDKEAALYYPLFAVVDDVMLDEPNAHLLFEGEDWEACAQRLQRHLGRIRRAWKVTRQSLEEAAKR